AAAWAPRPPRRQGLRTGGPMSPPLSAGPQSMPQVTPLGAQLTPVDVDVVEVRPVPPVRTRRPLRDRGAVVVRARAGEPGPPGPDALQHVGVRVPDGGQAEDLVIELPPGGAPRSAGG